jgi:hypothetical protein
VLGLTLAGSLLAGPAVAERAPTPGANGMGDPSFRGTEANTYATNSAKSLRRPSTRRMSTVANHVPHEHRPEDITESY